MIIFVPVNSPPPRPRAHMVVLSKGASDVLL
jgi:hypothetical protein